MPETTPPSPESALDPPCTVLHAFIEAGNCPGCHRKITHAQLVPGASAGNAEPVWKLNAIHALLSSHDKVRIVTAVGAILKFCPAARALIQAVDGAFRNYSLDDKDLMASLISTLAGRILTVDHVRILEQQLAEDEQSMILRIVLLSCFQMHSHASEAGRAAGQSHLLWLIRNCPELSGIVSLGQGFIYRDQTFRRLCQQLWQAHLEAYPASARIKQSAAKYFEADDPQKSHDLEVTAVALDSANWLTRLDFAHSCERRAQEALRRNDPATIRSCLAEIDALLHLPAGHETIELQLIAAELAFMADDLAKAEDYVTRALSDCADEIGASTVIHGGNILVGRIALRRGQIAEAGAALLRATTMAPSPAQSTFGPNMMLAKELLEAGERDVVLEYLRRCSEFWQTSDHRAEQWMHTVREGGMPDFKANLYYS